MPIRPKEVSAPLPIHQIEIDKAALDALPADVRRNFLLFGHIGNEINTLYRLLIFSLKAEEDRVLKLFAEFRAQTIARILIGTTHEGYLAVQRNILNQPFGQAYLPHMEEKGRRRWRVVRQHLSNTKLMASIRNNFAFHLPYPEQIDAAYAKLPADTDLSIYSGRPRHSSLYNGSLILMTQGMLDCADPDDKMTAEQAMSNIMDDAIDKSKALNDFIEALLETIVDRESLFPREKADVVLTVDGHQSMTSFRIPPLLRS
jgi:hypothetical protein